MQTKCSHPAIHSTFACFRVWSGSNGCCVLRLVRGSTAIAVGDSRGSRIQATTGKGYESAGSETQLTQTIHWVDSPSTTSAVTYKIQFATRGAGSATSYINRTGGDGNTTEQQTTASSLSVMEVQG